MYLAKKCKWGRVFELISQSNYDINNYVNDKGKTLLHIATINNYPSIVAELIYSGIDINQPDSLGQTALHSAAQYGRIGPAQILLTLKAEVNIVTYHGWSALHFAIERGHLPIVLLLIAAGAEINLITKDGKTCRDLATLKLLKNTGASIVPLTIIKDQIINAGGMFGTTLIKTKKLNNVPYPLRKIKIIPE